MMGARPHLRQVAVWTGAHVAVRVEEYGFDYVLYPYMLYVGGEGILHLAGSGAGNAKAGFWLGFLLLTAASLLLNLVYIRIYDWSRRDWFGIEALRHSALARRLSGSSHGAFTIGAAAFVFLSIWHSPLFATLAVRSRSAEYTMGRQDWAVFGAAVLVSNAGWALLVTAGVELLFVAKRVLGL